MAQWPPRADDVYKCLYEILTQCTQCEYIPVGVPTGSMLPVGICDSVNLPVEEQNLPLPVGICSSISLPVGICTVVSGGVEVTAPLPLPVGLCSSVEVQVREQQSPLPVGICSSTEVPVAIQGTPGVCVTNEVLVEISDISDGVEIPVAICAPDQIPVAICESTLVNKAIVPSIYNVGMSLANIEYSQTMPANTKKFLMHTEDGTEFRMAFETGRVAGLSPPYFTVPINSSYNEDFIEPAALGLYFAGICPGLTMEIVAWR